MGIHMKISDMKKEYENAGNGWLRAAFGREFGGHPYLISTIKCTG